MQPRQTTQNSVLEHSRSGLQKVKIDGIDRELYLKREDLYGYPGGNKMRRFIYWLKRNKATSSVVAISDPGAHTFYVLQKLLDHNPVSGSCYKRAFFLQTTRRLSAYSRVVHAQYVKDPRVHVLTAPFILLLLMQWFLQLFPRCKAVGIGGSFSFKHNPFADAFNDIYHKQSPLKGCPLVHHVFAMASGTMLDGFIQSLKKNSRPVQLHGITTGSPLARAFLRKKYRGISCLLLHPPQKCPEDRYLYLAEQFYRQTGVVLDPVHTIQLYEYLLQETIDPSEPVVVWLTAPVLCPLPF